MISILIDIIVYLVIGVFVAFAENKRRGMLKTGDGNNALGWFACTVFWPIIAAIWLSED